MLMTEVVVAVDVGGTVIKSALVDRAGQFLKRDRRPTGAAQGTEYVLGAILAAIATLREAAGEHEVVAVGVGVTGVIDEEAGIAVHSENVGWENAPLKSILERETGLPIGFGHDVRNGALAEAEYGVGRGYDDFIFVAIGTGVSAGVVIGGEVISGRGYSGEIGHVDAGLDEPCACGGTGCVEAVASAAAVARRYSELTGTDVDGAKEVAEQVRAGNPAAIRVWREATEALSRALAWSAGVVAPQAIVIGGGMAAAGDLLLTPLRERTAAHLNILPCPVIRQAELGDEAGCLGTAILAWRAAEGVS